MSHEKTRRVGGQHAAPLALAAVDAAVVDAAAGLRLENRLRDVDGQHVVFPRLDVIEALGEHPEGALGRDVEGDLRADGCVSGI